MSDDIGAAVVQLLKAAAPVAALAGEQLYEDVLKQKVCLPAATVEVDTDEPVSHMTGTSTLGQALVEVTCYGLTPLERTNLRKATEAALKTFTGVSVAIPDRFGGGTVLIKTAVPQLAIQEHERPIAGEGVGRFLHRRDWSVSYVSEV